MRKRYLSPEKSALMEVLVMFLPAIPAYIWIWPNVEGTAQLVFQLLTYAYVLAGTLFIGLRRWSLQQLGIKRDGLVLSLICGLALLLSRQLVLVSISWKSEPPHYTIAEVVGWMLFYLAAVGLVEELLFRGLVYLTLDHWLGTRWAIWGSSIGFVLWHIFGQGPLVGLAGLIYGLIFALIRWRAGGIMGLILVHALVDLQATLMVSGSNAVLIGQGRPDIAYPGWLALGIAMLVLIPLYLWKVHPYMEGRWRRVAV